MGKWSHLKGKLAPAPVDDPSYQQKIEQKKSELPDRPAVLGTEFCSWKDEKERLEDELKKVNLELEARSQKLVEWLENSGMTQFRLEDGTLLSIDDSPYCRLSDKQQFLQWVNDSNMQELLSVHYQTMSGLVKTGLEQGKNPPPGIEVFMKSSIRRYKPRS